MESAPDDASSAGGPRPAAIGVIVSIALHVLVMIGVRWIAPEAEEQRGLSVIDIDTAPIAPQAEALPPEQEAPPAAEAAGEAAASEDDVEMPEPPPPPDEGVAMADAGVPDAGVPDAGVPDAGVPIDAPAPVDARRKIDAAEELLAGADGGTEADAGSMVAAALDEDGGATVLDVTPDGGVIAAEPSDGGVVAVAAAGEADGGGVVGGLPGGTGEPNDGGVALIGPPGGADPSGSVTAKPSSGTAANLLNYFPRGHVVTVMVRMDRLRGTEWAERVDALLKPLPDHRALVGDADLRLADHFDLLVVSSPRPEDAVATTLLARTRMAPAELRDFLDQPDAPVAWAPVRGGALGKRGRSPRVFHGDQRVFLSWEPGWMVLTQPRDLGALTAPRTGEIDRAARAADLPPWLARAATIADESGEPTGPALMVTAANMFGAEIPLVGVGGASIPGPEQATLTVEIVDQGFLVRGNLRYADDSAAATATDAIARLREDLLKDLGSRFVLERVGAINPLKNLSLKRTGRRVAFATSASIAEARAMLAVTATFVTAHFEERRAVPVRRP